MSYVLLFLGNALVLVGILDPPLDGLLFVHDAHEPIHLPGTTVTLAASQKEICRRRDHERGVRRTAWQTLAG